jgi:hypothetical protein
MMAADACRRAGEIAVAAGFRLRHRSLKSEACYYGFPGRDGLLRVAAHAGKGDLVEGQRVIARLTFVYESAKAAEKQSLLLTRDQLEAQTAAAIGRFMIASGSEACK